MRFELDSGGAILRDAFGVGAAQRGASIHNRFGGADFAGVGHRTYVFSMAISVASEFVERRTQHVVLERALTNGGPGVGGVAKSENM